MDTYTQCVCFLFFRLVMLWCCYKEKKNKTENSAKCFWFDKSRLWSRSEQMWCMFAEISLQRAMDLSSKKGSSLWESSRCLRRRQTSTSRGQCLQVNTAPLYSPATVQRGKEFKCHHRKLKISSAWEDTAARNYDIILKMVWKKKNLLYNMQYFYVLLNTLLSN